VVVRFLSAGFREVSSEGAAMADDDALVTIYSTDRQAEIPLVKAWLDAEGIPYVTANEAISVIYPVDGMALVRLSVRRRDALKAVELLRAHGLK